MEKEEKKQPPTPIEEFNDNLKEYLATRYELTVLKTSQKVSIIASVATFGTIVAILIMLFLLFVSLAAGFYLSTVVGSYGHGFMILSGIFLLLALILFLGRRKWIMNPVKNYLIREMFDED